MIPADELLEMQTEFALACDQVATIKRNTSLGTPNPDGTTPYVLSTIYTNIPAMLNTPKGTAEVQLAAELADQSVFLVSFPSLIEKVAIDIRRDDLILIAGMTLTVQHLLFPQSYSVPQSVMASQPR